MLEKISVAFFAFVLEISLVIMIAKLTERKVTYESIATNGIITTVAAGTLLFDKKPLGFLLLAYASFLLTAGVREHEERKFGRDEWFGKVLKFFGHYITVCLILIIVLILEYIVPLFLP